MLTMYGYPTGNCIRAAIALAETGLPFKMVRVDLRIGQQAAPAYLALNPEGKVPTLVDDAADEPVVVTQSNAIMIYAAESAPGTLLPATAGPERALAYQRYFYFVTEVVQNLLSTYALRGPTNREAVRIFMERAITALAYSDHFLHEARFMAGSSFSIADVVAISVVPTFEQHLPWEQLPNLHRWFKEVSTRPSVVHGVQAFGPSN